MVFASTASCSTWACRCHVWFCCEFRSSHSRLWCHIRFLWRLFQHSHNHTVEVLASNCSTMLASALTCFLYELLSVVLSAYFMCRTPLCTARPRCRNTLYRKTACTEVFLRRCGKPGIEKHTRWWHYRTVTTRCLNMAACWTFFAVLIRCCFMSTCYQLWIEVACLRLSKKKKFQIDKCTCTLSEQIEPLSASSVVNTS